jgi:GDP-L-fucose synthase
VTRLTEMGWKPKISLREGIEATYRWFLDQGRIRYPQGSSPEENRHAE